MPNFWSRGLQYIGEKLGAEITQDKDLDKILNKIDKIEKGFSQFRTIIQNFNSYVEKFSTFFTDLNNALDLIYSNTPYYSLIEEFLVKQQLIKVHIEDMKKLLNKLYSRSSEWDKIFTEGKNQLLEREEKRKIYDHYEKKLIKIKDSKDKKYIERNEEKYTKAASEYVEISEKIYKKLEHSIKLGWELANPLVSELILGEQKMFEDISSTLSCFKDNIKRFEEINKSISNPNSKMLIFNYDPVKFIKAKDLIKKVSINRTKTVHINKNNKNMIKKARSSKFNFFFKIEEMNSNYDNILINTRLTNSFGKIPNDKLKEFREIEDDLS